MRSLCLALALIGSGAMAAVPQGSYVGAYRCAHGETGLQIDVQPADGGSQFGLFRFDAPQGSGSFVVRFDRVGTDDYRLMPIRWRRAARGWSMVASRLRASGGRLEGRVEALGCGAFVATLGGAAVAMPAGAAPGPVPARSPTSASRSPRVVEEGNGCYLRTDR